MTSTGPRVPVCRALAACAGRGRELSVVCVSIRSCLFSAGAAAGRGGRIFSTKVMLSLETAKLFARFFAGWGMGPYKETRMNADS